MPDDTSLFFSKLAVFRQRYPQGDFWARPTSDINQPDAADDSYVAAMKTAASLHDMVRALRSMSGSHLFNAALYAPLVAADLHEARKARRAGGSGMLPTLAGSALAVMMAQHLAPVLHGAVQNKSVQNFLTRAGVGGK